MLTLSKEPLLHFALLGTLLFALFTYLNPLADGPDQVLVSAQKVQHLTTIFSKKWQRSPTAAELKKMIDDYILEEVYYREAMAMQMDKNDTVIRRRLRQKMEFLMIDLSKSMAPTDSQLQAFLDQHADDFALDARYSFSQIYLDPNKHQDIDQAISRIQSQLDSGKIAIGDTTMLPKSFNDSPASRINALLGETFVAQLPGLKSGQWQGPVRSGFGLHWVNLTQNDPARHPDLKDVYATVLREWRHDFQLKTEKEVNKKLLEQYNIQINWPERLTPPPDQQLSQLATKDNMVKTDD